MQSSFDGRWRWRRGGSRSSTAWTIGSAGQRNDRHDQAPHNDYPAGASDLHLCAPGRTEPATYGLEVRHHPSAWYCLEHRRRSVQVAGPTSHNPAGAVTTTGLPEGLPALATRVRLPTLRPQRAPLRCLQSFRRPLTAREGGATLGRPRALLSRRRRACAPSGDLQGRRTVR